MQAFLTPDFSSAYKKWEGSAVSIFCPSGVSICFSKATAHVLPVDPSTDDVHRRTAGWRSDTDHPKNIDGHWLSSKAFQRESQQLKIRPC
jgi:hypothetical protein